MNPSEPFLAIDDLSGGLNNTDGAMAIAPNQVAKAVNVEWYRHKMPKKRAGCTSISLAPWSPSGIIAAMFPYTPTPWSITSKVGFAITSAREFGYWDGVNWTSLTPSPNDTLSISSISPSTAVNFNNKLFFTYSTAGSPDRMHVWDNDTTTLRRVGVGTPAAPTRANTGSGSYAATLRYYKVAYAVLSGSTVLRRSELSAAVSITPSGSGTAIQVTKPTTISEGETHWELYGSADGVTYYRIATTVVGTTTYDDSAAPSSYSGGTLADDTGDHTPPVGVKYAVVHGNRLVLAADWTETHPSRVWFTSVLGETGVGDDERVPVDNYLDIDPGVGHIRGMGVIFGSIIVSKATLTVSGALKGGGLYKLVATGDPDAPYNVVKLSSCVGAIRHNAIVEAQDEHGGPALYWWSREGPYRYGAQGLQYLGDNIRATLDDVYWNIPNVALALHYENKKQLWWWVTTFSGASGGNQDPDLLLVYNIVTGSYTTYTGTVAKATCAALFPDHTTDLRPLKPYLGAPTGTSFYMADSGTQDGGANFQAYVKTRAYPLAGWGANTGVTEGLVCAEAGAAVTLRLTLDRDFGLETRTTDCLLTAAASETHVIKKYEDACMTSAQVMQFQVGDAAAVNSAWQLAALSFRYRGEEVR